MNRSANDTFRSGTNTSAGTNSGNTNTDTDTDTDTNTNTNTSYIDTLTKMDQIGNTDNSGILVPCKKKVMFASCRGLN